VTARALCQHASPPHAGTYSNSTGEGACWHGGVPEQGMLVQAAAVPARPGKENTPEGGMYFVLYVFVLYFVLYLYFLAPATRDRCGGRKRDGASCPGCPLGTWLCSMSNSIIYHVSCYRFVSQHTYNLYTTYHIGPHAHVDTDSDSRQQQQPPASAPAVAQMIQNSTKSSLLYYVLYVLIVLCIVLCISDPWARQRVSTGQGPCRTGDETRAGTGPCQHGHLPCQHGGRAGTRQVDQYWHRSSWLLAVPTQTIHCICTLHWLACDHRRQIARP
jgi:hypothetical protein